MHALLRVGKHHVVFHKPDAARQVAAAVCIDRRVIHRDHCAPVDLCRAHLRLAYAVALEYDQGRVLLSKAGDRLICVARKIVLLHRPVPGVHRRVVPVPEIGVRLRLAARQNDACATIRAIGRRNAAVHHAFHRVGICKTVRNFYCVVLARQLDIRRFFQQDVSGLRPENIIPVPAVIPFRRVFGQRCRRGRQFSAFRRDPLDIFRRAALIYAIARAVVLDNGCVVFCDFLPVVCAVSVLACYLQGLKVNCRDQIGPPVIRRLPFQLQVICLPIHRQAVYRVLLA